MGAIASRKNPEALDLFREVLVASAAIPGVFPPVMIPTESGDHRQIDEMHKTIQKWGRDFQDIWIGLAQAADRAEESFHRNSQALIEAINRAAVLNQTLEPFRSDIPNSLDGTTRRIVSLYEAMDIAGVKTRRSLVDAVEEARQVYLRLAEARQRGDTGYVITQDAVNERLRIYLELKKAAATATDADLRGAS